MGLPLPDAMMMICLLAEEDARSVVCLGNPTIFWSWMQLNRTLQDADLPCPPAIAAFRDSSEKPSGATLFETLGFDDVRVMDISDYEGADIVHDLNSGALPERLHGSTDLIYDGGTLEHVFHVPNALNAIHDLLRLNGIVIHHSPSNGYLDHGFWQICPTLYHDFYSENGYQIVSASVVSQLNGDIVFPYSRDIYRSLGWGETMQRFPRATSFFAARKKAESTRGAIPMQSFYRRMHEGESQPYENERPFAFSLRESALKIAAKKMLPKPVASTARGFLEMARGVRRGK